MLFGDRYRGARVLITGHTGFKGSWLSLWLDKLGATIKGISLSGYFPNNHWELLDISSIEDSRIDIRDAQCLSMAINAFKPDIVFHLAAQSLVRQSYSSPLDSWSTNVMGTANLLEACRGCTSVKAIIVVTTDKCYENKEWVWGYRETDALGGYDPYSASKAAAEILVSSYRRSFFGSIGSPMVATARAGNVIGGGDWSDDRLIPDVVRCALRGAPATIRSPNSIRPWQHVLESLSGYLLLGERLLEGNSDYADAWNFGPVNEGHYRVEDVLKIMKKTWSDIEWLSSSGDGLHESVALQLDSAKARQKLNWRPVWSIQKGIDQTAGWYKAWQLSNEAISRIQLDEYIQSAVEEKLVWCS
ncbi:cdp-glucose 4,6-dehydratase [Oleiphilus messinensis]|uniref:Cdp-glucose 4,6-dehydratase n=1 Tax=Oleiphilus messinensis TaxID=141451 RepID=A0A1Y0I742_9GAMM|nr:CDP-glucose 4,6-dehydratase [Oleiphilus messinensis]ARU56009.1 cdp-glucose 4,6-dehydratase [Oleiphilus messinensis]